MTNAEIIKEWENSEVCKRVAGLETFAGAHGWEGWQGENIPDLIVRLASQARQSALEECKGVVPHEQCKIIGSINATETWEWAVGWNACRFHTLAAIEGLIKKTV